MCLPVLNIPGTITIKEEIKESHPSNQLEKSLLFFLYKMDMDVTDVKFFTPPHCKLREKINKI